MLSCLGTISNSRDKCYFSLSGIREGDAVTKGNFSPHFRQMGESKELFSISAMSQLPSAQIILMLKWHVLGVSYTELRHISILLDAQIISSLASRSLFLSLLKQPSSLNSSLDLWLNRGSRFLSYIPVSDPG